MGISFYTDFIFLIVALVFFILTIVKSNQYIKFKSVKLFKTANTIYSVSTVLFCIVCLRLIYSFIDISKSIELLARIYSRYGGFGTTEVLTILYMLFLVAAFVLGIVSNVRFGKVRKLFQLLNPPPMPNYYNGNPYGNYGVPYHNGGNLYGGYNQNGMPPYYGQQYPPQQPVQPPCQYVQPSQQSSQPPQQYAEPSQPPMPPQQSSAYPNAELDTAESINKAEAVNAAENESKRCPHCGVSNSGSNKFCTFCGREL